MKRTLELTIDLHEENFSLDIRDPDSCIHNEFSFFYSRHDLLDFNQTVGEEIYSWISLWRDAQDEMED